MAVANWKLVGMGGDAAGSDLGRRCDIYIWRRIAGKVLTDELLKLEILPRIETRTLKESR